MKTNKKTAKKTNKTPEAKKPYGIKAYGKWTRFATRDIRPTPAEEYLLDYGDKFCKLFKCAAKVTAAWTPDGTRTCSWYSPDGKLNRDAKGLKGEPSQSLEDFVKEWNNAR